VPIRFALTSALLLWFAPNAPAAIPRPDFSGHWVVDLEASDSLDSILRLLERSWIERKLASHAEVENVITQTSEVLVIQIKASFYDETERMPIDHEWHERDKPATGEYASRTYWDDQSLITQNRFDLPSGLPALLTVTRRIEPQTNQLLQTTRLEASGQTLEARRVWQRKVD